MAVWEKGEPTLGVLAGGERVNVSESGSADIRILSPSFRFVDGETEYGIIGHGMQIVATPFDPLELFGDGDEGDLWLATSIEADLGDSVAAWDGLYSSISLAQAVAGRQPTLRGSGNKRWLQFDIDDLDNTDVLGDCLLGEFAISTAELTVIIAAHNEDYTEDTDAGGNRRTFCLKVPEADAAERDLNIHHNLAGHTSSGRFGAAGVRHPQDAPVSLNGNNQALALPGVVTYQRDGTTIQDAWVDGVARTRNTTTTTTFESTHLGIGYGLAASLAFNTTGDGHWIGKIAGVLVIDRVLTAAERIKAEAYMATLLD